MPEGNRSGNKQKLSALALQEEYLATGDPDVIGRLYEELMGLAKDTARLNRIEIDPDDMEDIVQSVCIRLFEHRQPVMRTAPVSYLKSAMKFKVKRYGKYESIDAEGFPEIATTDRTFIEIEEETQAYEALLQVVADNPDITPGVRHHVEVCIEERRNWMEYRSSRIKEFSQKREFTEVMKELRNAAEEIVQGA